MDKHVYHRKNSAVDVVAVVLFSLFIIVLMFSAVATEYVADKAVCVLLAIIVIVVLFKWVTRSRSVPCIKLTDHGVTVYSQNNNDSVFYEFPYSIKKVEYVGGRSRIVLKLYNEKEKQSFILASWRFKRENDLVRKLNEIINNYVIQRNRNEGNNKNAL